MFQSFNSTQTTRFGRGSVIIRAQDGLDDAQIQAHAPAVFAQGAHESRSDKYSYIPTSSVLTGLRKEGFVPVEVRQGGSGDEVKRQFTKHLIRLRHQSSLMVGDSVREIILLNAHDGTSSYQLMSGLFRIVCSNGLITCEDGQIQRVAHKGDIVHNVIEGAYRIVDNDQEIRENVEEMSNLLLTKEEQHVFADAALQLRYNAKDEEGNAKEAPIAADRLNDVRRSGDSGADLWRTFNRVQENLIRGGVDYVHRADNGRRSYRATRPVQSIDGNVNLNRALWTLANKMAELKAA